MNIMANCRMRLASHWQNKKRHCRTIALKVVTLRNKK